MQLLVAYDVNTLTKEGRSRLRRVAKICEGHGQRVQMSVFECTVNEAQKEVFRNKLLDVIEPVEDNLRIYTLIGRRDEYVDAYGRDLYRDFTEPLIF